MEPDVAAIVAKVKEGKKAKKPAAKKEPQAAKAPAKAPAARRQQPATFLRNVAGQGEAAAAAVSLAAAAKDKKAPAKPRTMPAQQRLKLVFDHVRQNRGQLAFDAITAATKVDIAGDLLPLLEQHRQLEVDTAAKTLQYRPLLTLAGRSDVEELLRRRPFGVLSSEIADAYAAGVADVAAMVADGAAFEVDSAEKVGSVVYPNGTALPGGPPADDVRDALFAVALPETEAARDQALAAASITKAKRSTARLKMAVITDDKKAGRPKKARKLRNVTNAHLAHLFDDDGADGAIDR